MYDCPHEKDKLNVFINLLVEPKIPKSIDQLMIDLLYFGFSCHFELWTDGFSPLRTAHVSTKKSENLTYFRCYITTYLMYISRTMNAKIFRYH